MLHTDDQQLLEFVKDELELNKNMLVALTYEKCCGPDNRTARRLLRCPLPTSP